MGQGELALALGASLFLLSPDPLCGWALFDEVTQPSALSLWN